MKSQSYLRTVAPKQASQWLAMALCIALLTLFLAPIAAYGQATTVVTATVKDVSGNVVPTGQVTFDLKPGIDTAINGNARFTPQTTVCTINQAQNGGAGTITSLVRASGVVTATFSAQTTFLVGDTLSLCSWSDATFNGYNAFTVTAVSSVSPWTVTWNQVGVDSSATSGSISALRASPSGPCTVTQNTALTPAGTFYKVTFWPNFSPTSALNFYATTNTVDLASVVPTPATIPAYSFLDLFSTQTITGPKTFVGATTLSVTGNSAIKPGASDGIQFVSANGNDANDGFSRGTAKATITGAISACGTAKCQVYISSGYTGTDCPPPSTQGNIVFFDFRALGPANPPCGYNTDSWNGQTPGVRSFLRHSWQLVIPSISQSYELTTNLASYSGSLPGSGNSIEGPTFVATITGTPTFQGTTLNLIGSESHAFLNSTGGTLPNAYGFVTSAGTVTGTTGITTAAGILVQTNLHTGGSIANNYGILMQAQSGGTIRNFSFYAQGGGLFSSDASSDGVSFEDSALATHPILTSVSSNNEMRFRPLLDTAGYDWTNAASTTNWLLINSTGISIPSLPFSVGNLTGGKCVQTGTGGLLTSAPGSCNVAGAAVDLTAQSANIASTTIVTPAANGFYRVSAYIVLTQAATTSSSLPSVNVLWTDGDSSVAETQVLTNTPTTNAVGELGVPVSTAVPSFFAKSGTVIQYSTNGYASAGATAMQYALHIRLEGPF